MENKLQLQKYSQIDNLFDEEAAGYPPKTDLPDWLAYGNYGEDDKVHLREFWRTVRRHKWMVFSIVTLITAFVAVQAYQTKPWYSASAVIEIGKENSMVLKSGELTLNDDSDPFYLVNVNTKKLALNSPELFEDVILEQKLDQNPKFIEKVQKRSIVSLFAFSDEADVPETKGSSAPPPNRPAGISNEAAPRPAEETLRLAPFVEYLQKNLSVEQVKDARALKVTVTDEDPILAADIANSIGRIFMQRSFDKQTERFTNSANWLNNSTRELKAKVEVAEKALANYTRDNQIYATELGDEKKNPTLTTAKLSQLHDQYIRVQTERMLKKSLYEQVQAGRIAELPEAFSDPKITLLQQQLAALQKQDAELKVKFGPANPKVIEVKNQIEVLTSQIETGRKALEAKLRADYERAVKDEKTLSSALNSAKFEAVNENQASIKYNILKQDVETARSLYTDFLQKTNQAKAQVAEQNNNIKIIQNAQPPIKPVGPKRLLLILAGFILSLGGGVGLALLIDYLDNTVKSLEDAERYAQLPVLGIIPGVGKASSRLLSGKAKNIPLVTKTGRKHGAERSVTKSNFAADVRNYPLIAEAYRMLRTLVLLSSAENPPKTILITSGQAGEGKTTTAVNTAISLAQLGAQVLIVDCDLRRPSVHKHLGVDNSRGVSTYLSRRTSLIDLIQELEIPNLSVLASGEPTPNPAELLSSRRMKDMLTILGESYDYVIIDSPPIINVTDPVILSTLVDGTMMVIHAGKTTREAVLRSRQELSAVRAKVLGVVLNKVNLKRDL